MTGPAAPATGPANTPTPSSTPDTLRTLVAVVLHVRDDHGPLEGAQVEVVSLRASDGVVREGAELAAWLAAWPAEAPGGPPEPRVPPRPVDPTDPGDPAARPGAGAGPGSGEPVARVLTDAEGAARLLLPPGHARLRVARLGYASASPEVEVDAGPAPDEPRALELRVTLEPEALRLEGVTVGVTRSGRRVQDEPLRVEVLDREEIEEKMLMTPGNIVMLLNETGGLRVQTTSPSLGAANIRVQGMRGRYTQLLADGLPLYGGQAGAIGLMQIPPVDLGQVEVVKGVASALHGGSALGGVVNLVSRRPDDDDPEAEFLLNATSQGGQDLTGYLATPLAGDWSASVVGSAHRQDARDLDGSGWAELAGFRRGTFRPRLFREGEDGASVLVTLGAMVETREGGTMEGGTVPGGDAAGGVPFPEALDTRRFDGGVTAQHPLGGERFLQLRASGMVQDHDHRFGELEESDRHATAFAELAVAGGGLDHGWVWGVAIQHDRYRSETFPGFDYDFSVPALFGQHEVRFTPEVTVSGSARLDGHSAYGRQVSPRVSVLYRPGAWTFRGSVGGGYFAPTPFVEEIEAAGVARLAPLDGLRAERARTASVDAGRSVGPFELNATLFASRVEDAVQLVPIAGPWEPGAPRVRLANVPGQTRTGGVEGLARYRREGISVTGSYVFVGATEPAGGAGGAGLEGVGMGMAGADAGGAGVGGAGVAGADAVAGMEMEGAGDARRRAVPLTPRHTAGLVFMWEDHDRGLLGIEAYFTGRQELDDNPYRDRARAHVHLGVLGEVRREGWSVFVNAENLLNVRQTRYDPLVRPTRAADGRWTVDAWAPLEGFAVNGGVRIWLGGHEDH